MIPLRMRRSSLRSGPGWLIGKCGTIFAHCSSLNQNSVEVIGLAPSPDQAFESHQPCLGLEPKEQQAAERLRWGKVNPAEVELRDLKITPTFGGLFDVTAGLKCSS